MVKNSNISYEELEELLNTYDKVIVPHLDWGNRGIYSLPENFGNLEVEGDLDLYFNQLTSLPESFGNLKVGGKLRLQNNPWIIDTDFADFYEKYKEELVLDKKTEEEINRFIKLEEWEEKNENTHLKEK